MLQKGDSKKKKIGKIGAGIGATKDGRTRIGQSPIGVIGQELSQTVLIGMIGTGMKMIGVAIGMRIGAVAQIGKLVLLTHCPNRFPRIQLVAAVQQTLHQQSRRTLRRQC